MIDTKSRPANSKASFHYPTHPSTQIPELRKAAWDAFGKVVKARTKNKDKREAMWAGWEYLIENYPLPNASSYCFDLCGGNDELADWANEGMVIATWYMKTGEVR